MSAPAFHRDVVKSVALSCLLSMDFVPGAKPPPADEMVRHELPRVLRTVAQTQVLGPVELELGQYTANPVDLLRRVTERITDFPKASEAVITQGHLDTVFSAMMYMRKQPTATCNRIRRVTRDVAAALEVDVPDDFDERIGEMYDATHGMLLRV